MERFSACGRVSTASGSERRSRSPPIDGTALATARGRRSFPQVERFFVVKRKEIEAAGKGLRARAAGEECGTGGLPVPHEAVETVAIRYFLFSVSPGFSGQNMIVFALSINLQFLGAAEPGSPLTRGKASRPLE